MGLGSGLGLSNCFNLDAKTVKIVLKGLELQELRVRVGVGVGVRVRVWLGIGLGLGLGLGLGFA